MKKLITIIALLCFTIIANGQIYYSATSTTIKDMVDNHTFGIFRITGTFVETINEEKLLFTVEDQEYIIPIQLAKKDLGAVNRFRALNLQKGDTLVITGRLEDIYVAGESYKGLTESLIIQEDDAVLTASDSEDDSDSIPYQLVEVKPKFNGGDMNAFSRWINSQLKYPEYAKENGIMGRVLVRFTIKADGSVSNVQILRGVHESLDNEAIRVISSSPKWEPGRSKGKPVDVHYTYPLSFYPR